MQTKIDITQLCLDGAERQRLWEETRRHPLYYFRNRFQWFNYPKWRYVAPRYWKLINEFRKLTGVGIVLNSSFNDNDEPIVRSPKDAIRTFFGTGLYELYIGYFKVRKS